MFFVNFAINRFRKLSTATCRYRKKQYWFKYSCCYVTRLTIPTIKFTMKVICPNSSAIMI
jgi:hypothetical protein